MGAVKSQLIINDGMTSALRRINKAMGLMLNNFEAVQRASGNSINTANIADARQELGRANAQLDAMEESYRNINNQQDTLNRGLTTGTSKADKLLGKLKSIASGYLGIQAVAKLVNLSDKQAQTSARLSLIVDDKNTVKSLEDKIFASAQRSRAAYQTTADAVSKLGMQAGKAFNSNDELIAFTELLNKSFVIAGTEAQGIDSVMLQITQAMAAGKLQGEELNAVLDNAQPIVANIQRYLEEVHNINADNIKKLASEGVITADIIKNAMFYAAKDINGDFEDMPMTWAQVWTMTCNKLLRLAQPLLNFINFLAKNWSILEPIILGVAAAIGLYLIATKGVTLAQKVGTIAAGVFTAAQNFLSIGFGVLRGSTAAASAAQFQYNSALMKSPITWTLFLLIALVATVYAIVAAVNKLTDKTISATGIIFGAVFWLASVIWNTVIGVINAIIQFLWTNFVEPWIGIIEWVLNVFNGGFNSFGDGVKNLLGNIISWFLSLGEVVTKIIDAIFGTNWTGGLNALQGKVLAWGKNENAITLSREAPTIQSLTGGKVDRWASKDAWSAGYSFGEGIGSKVSEKLNFEDLAMSDTIGDIADDTSSLAGSSDKTTEELAYLRDIAEKEAINRFTTAEVKVELTSHNNISNDMDIDGVVDHFTTAFVDALATAAEGVHEDEL